MLAASQEQEEPRKLSGESQGTFLDRMRNTVSTVSRGMTKIIDSARGVNSGRDTAASATVNHSEQAPEVKRANNYAENVASAINHMADGD